MLKSGYKMTEEHKRKISEALKRLDYNAYRLGTKQSEETKKKISQALKGQKRKPLSEEHKKKLSKSLQGNPNLGWAKGTHISEERKKKLSEIEKGEGNPFYGKKHTEESIRKMSEAARIRVPSKETRQKISANTKGEGNPNWKGGITPLIFKIRNNPKYIQWRSDVFTRDNFTCQNCGDNKGGNLEAHHIKRLKDIKEANNIKAIGQALSCDELWDINNGITLCNSCHKSIHRKKVA